MNFLFGLFSNGLKHGFGIEKFLDSNEKYLGSYKDNKRDGKGILYYPTGIEKYYGDWKDDNMKVVV